MTSQAFELDLNLSNMKSNNIQREKILSSNGFKPTYNALNAWNVFSAIKVDPASFEIWSCVTAQLGMRAAWALSSQRKEKDSLYSSEKQPQMCVTQSPVLFLELRCVEQCVYFKHVIMHLMKVYIQKRKVKINRQTVQRRKIVLVFEHAEDISFLKLECRSIAFDPRESIHLNV